MLVPAGMGAVGLVLRSWDDWVAIHRSVLASFIRFWSAVVGFPVTTRSVTTPLAHGRRCDGRVLTKHH